MVWNSMHTPRNNKATYAAEKQRWFSPFLCDLDRSLHSLLLSWIQTVFQGPLALDQQVSVECRRIDVAVYLVVDPRGM